MPTAPSKASSGTKVIAAESEVPLALAAAALVEANVAETPGCTSVAALPVPEAAEAAEAALVVAEVATAAVVGVVATVPARTVVLGTEVESTVALVKVVERAVELSDVTDVDNNVDVLNGVLLSTEFTADVNAAACVCRLVNSALKLVASAPVAVSASLEIDAMLASAADC
ncbi:hypothetical protein LTR49_023062 [Elasticomyces elasticus]|nr:hypothetical protein LTR49_023062 [Elasticomyces elasticus]KAK5741828.1 hypothetical protein LTS12_024464 [Elasticomyces elasticus]